MPSTRAVAHKCHGVLSCVQQILGVIVVTTLPYVSFDSDNALTETLMETLTSPTNSYNYQSASGQRVSCRRAVNRGTSGLFIITVVSELLRVSAMS